MSPPPGQNGMCSTVSSHLYLRPQSAHFCGNNLRQLNRAQNAMNRVWCVSPTRSPYEILSPQFTQRAASGGDGSCGCVSHPNHRHRSRLTNASRRTASSIASLRFRLPLMHSVSSHVACPHLLQIKNQNPVAAQHTEAFCEASAQIVAPVRGELPVLRGQP